MLDYWCSMAKIIGIEFWVTENINRSSQRHKRDVWRVAYQASILNA